MGGPRFNEKGFLFCFYLFIYLLFLTGSAAWKYGGGRFNEFLFFDTHCRLEVLPFH